MKTAGIVSLAAIAIVAIVCGRDVQMQMEQHAHEIRVKAIDFACH